MLISFLLQDNTILLRLDLFPYYQFAAIFFERLNYNELFTFFTDNNFFISPNQPGFRPGGFCVNQLLAITHEIYKSLDDGLEVRGVFLDISKVFDNVWYEGLLLKLSNGISGNFLKFLNVLYCCKQRVVLNGKHSTWEKVNPGVPQGSILGPLLFLIYNNDLSKGLPSNCKLFAEDQHPIKRSYLTQ